MEPGPVYTSRCQVSGALPAQIRPAVAPDIDGPSTELSTFPDCSLSSSKLPIVDSAPSSRQPRSISLPVRPSSPPSYFPPSSSRSFHPYPRLSPPPLGSFVMRYSGQPELQTTLYHPMNIPPQYANPHMKMLQHNQPLPKSEHSFKCDQCTQSFNRRHDLKRHKRIHLAEKPFTCTFCSKSFSRKDALKRHRLVNGCGKESAKGEEPDPNKTDADILTKDYMPGLDMCTESHLPLSGSIACSTNNPSLITSQENKPVSQDDIPLHSVKIETDILEETVDTSSMWCTNSSSQQTISNFLRLSEDLECRVSPQTPQSDRSSSVPEAYIDERKRQIVNIIVYNVAQWLHSIFDAYRRNNGGNSSGASGTSGGPHPKEKPSNHIQLGGKKRKSSQRDDPGTDDDNEDEHEDGRPDSKRPIESHQNPKYACPYFKYNPTKYKDWRICPGPGWVDIHRMKEHLYRRNRQPKYRCGRCWQPFKDEQCYLNHLRTEEACPLREMEHVEGFDAAQELSLKSRKRSDRELSEDDKWNRVFKILFPHVLEKDIPSPFYEYKQTIQKEKHSGSDYLAQCEDYMVREVPQRLRQALGRELDRDLTIVEESLRRKAGDWVKTLLEEAFRELRQNRPSDSPSQPLGTSDEMDLLIEDEGSRLLSVLDSQSHSSDNNGAHGRGEGEAWLSNFNLDSFDAFAFLGEPEFSFDNGGLLEDLLKPDESSRSQERKHSDSGYGSHSPRNTV